MKQEALDCLSLSYKYYTLRDCVKSQRPILMDDFKLSLIDAQIEHLEQLFEDRIRTLAYYEKEET